MPYSFNGISAKSRHPVFLPKVHKKAISTLTISLTASRPVIPSYAIKGCLYLSIYLYTASIYSFYGISAKTSELRSCVKVEVDVDDELMLNVLRCHETY